MSRTVQAPQPAQVVGRCIPRQQISETVADPLYNVAAQLRCARSLVMGLEDDSQDAADSRNLHAVQRVLEQCIEACEAVASAAIDRLAS